MQCSSSNKIDCKNLNNKTVSNLVTNHFFETQTYNYDMQTAKLIHVDNYTVKRFQN